MLQIIDLFGHKRCQKKRKDVDYKLLQDFFQKYFVAHERSAVKNYFNTYLCMLCTWRYILVESVLKMNTKSFCISIFIKFSGCFGAWCKGVWLLFLIYGKNLFVNGIIWKAMEYFYREMIGLILHTKNLRLIRPLLQIQPSLTVSIYLDHPVLKSCTWFKNLIKDTIEL